MKQQYLLIEDVEDIGRAGEIITAKPGFARNFLLPKQKAVRATPHTLRMKERLEKERAEKAAVDRREAESLADRLRGITLKIAVRVDAEGHMFGSVGNKEVIELFAEHGVRVERRNIGLNKPIKQTGVHPLTLKLNEGVTCEYTLHIIGEQDQKSFG